MSKQWRNWLVLALFTGLLLYSVNWVLAAWVHLPGVLSVNNSECDLEPRTALSADYNRLAAIWIQGRKVNDGCVSRGTAVLRWVTQNSTQNTWSAPLYFQAEPLSCMVHADVSVRGDTVHVAATVWSPCDELESDSRVVYTTCDLTTGVCAALTNVVAQDGAAGRLLTDVHIEADVQNRPHIVYGQAAHDLTNALIFYTRKLGAAWDTPKQLSPNNESSYRAATAYSNGKIHITWENHRDYKDVHNNTHQNGDVRVISCAEAGACAPFSTVYRSVAPLRLEGTYPLPSIAARDDRVLLVWNVCADLLADPPCERFYLVYVRSDNNGETFSSEPLEVGTNTQIRFINNSTRFYQSSDVTELAGEYATHIRPSVTLDPANLPYVAWHMKQAAGYVISATRAISATADFFTWSDANMGPFGAGLDNRIYPEIALTPYTGAQALHLVYMKTWLEGVWLRSQILYDVQSPARPVFQFLDTTREAGLPEGRMQHIAGQVRLADGTPLSGVAVVYSTTLGGFSVNGFGPTQTIVTSNAQGYVTATLYTNLAGATQVRAWIDSTQDYRWASEEPSDVLTQTWTLAHAPSLATSPGPVMAGDLITAALAYHPYANPLEVGQVWEYTVWWCPAGPNTTPASQQVAGPFTIDMQTWAYENLMLEVPQEVSGTYRLESHNSGLDDLCDDPTSLMAASAPLQASSVVLPGVLLIGNARPYPGEVMTATLQQHPTSSLYDVWWCTNSGKPISQVVVSDVTVDAEGFETVSLQTPLQAQGLYHLESHEADAIGATCGNLTTREAASALIWPRSKILLPLIMRSYKR